MTKTVKLAFAMNLLMGGLLVGGAGCDAERGDDAATAGTQPTAERSPELVASLTLDNGNPLEFYDFGTGALVSEVGMADSTSPRFNPEEHALADLTTIWRSLAPDQAVPVRLASLQERLKALPPSAIEPSGDRLPSIEAVDIVPEIDPSGATLAAPEGCDNRCCDADWLRTLSQCRPMGDKSWFKFNTGATIVQSIDPVREYSGLACAAIGTSSFTVSMTDAGGTWIIPEGGYRTYTWRSPLPFAGKKKVTASTNRVSSPRMHTHCGYFIY